MPMPMVSATVRQEVTAPPVVTAVTKMPPQVVAASPQRSHRLVYRQPQIQYGNVAIHVAKHVLAFQPVVPIYLHRKSELTEWVESCDFSEDARQVFLECVTDHSLYLDWKSGSIQAFINRLFARKDLPPVPEQAMYDLFRAFDTNGDMKLDGQEACNIARAVADVLASAIRQQDIID